MLSNSSPVHPVEIDANSLKLRFLQLLQKRCSVYHACIKLGISRTTVYNDWLDKDAEFKRRFDEVRMGHVDGIEGVLFNDALHDKKATIARIFILKSWKPERYGDRADVSFSGKVDLDVSNLASRLVEAGRNARQSLEDAPRLTSREVALPPVQNAIIVSEASVSETRANLKGDETP